MNEQDRMSLHNAFEEFQVACGSLALALWRDFVRLNGRLLRLLVWMSE